jgi:hypothetical protein
MKYLISEGIGLKLKSDIIFLNFVAVVNIVLPWIDFKAAMISSWWSQRFQRRRFKCEKLTDGRTDDGRLPMTKAHMAYGQVS